MDRSTRTVEIWWPPCVLHVMHAISFSRFCGPKFAEFWGNEDDSSSASEALRNAPCKCSTYLLTLRSIKIFYCLLVYNLHCVSLHRYWRWSRKYRHRVTVGQNWDDISVVYGAQSSLEFEDRWGHLVLFAVFRLLVSCFFIRFAKPSKNRQFFTPRFTERKLKFLTTFLPRCMECNAVLRWDFCPSVRLSVCLSNACIVTKRKKR